MDNFAVEINSKTISSDEYQSIKYHACPLRLRSELRSDRLAEDKHRQRMEPGQGATPAAQGKGKGGGGGASGVGGHGKGLALSKAIIEKLGGHVSVRSCEQMGTCFLLRFTRLAD